MKLINDKEIKEILIKSWMTHDGMWFRYCLEECGIEKTNKINKAAIRAMAKIEINRIKTLSGMKEINSFTELKRFIEIVFIIVKGNFMDFKMDFSSSGTFLFEMHRCFAYNGVSRIGIIDKYECGIFERIDTWFKELGLNFRATPEIKKCQFLKGEKCIRRYEFYFDK